MTQYWGYAYYHFLAECLPRITLMLDVLLEHPETKVAYQVSEEGSGRIVLCEMGVF